MDAAAAGHAALDVKRVVVPDGQEPLPDTAREDASGPVDGAVTADAGEEIPPFTPVIIQCGGNDQFTSHLCTPDGYCDFDAEGKPSVVCCDEPCDGEMGGAGSGPPPRDLPSEWVVNGAVADGAPCQEIGLSIRTWTYGLGNPRRQ